MKLVEAAAKVTKERWEVIERKITPPASKRSAPAVHLPGQKPKATPADESLLTQAKDLIARLQDYADDQRRSLGRISDEMTEEIAKVRKRYRQLRVSVLRDIGTVNGAVQELSGRLNYLEGLEKHHKL